MNTEKTFFGMSFRNIIFFGCKRRFTKKRKSGTIITKEEIIACDFSGNVLDGVDRVEKFQRDAYILRSMRADFDLFNKQLCILGRNESRILIGYLSGEKDIGDIAEEEGIQYESAVQKLRLRYR